MERPAWAVSVFLSQWDKEEEHWAVSKLPLSREAFPGGGGGGRAQLGGGRARVLIGLRTAAEAVIGSYPFLSLGVPHKSWILLASG